MSRQWENKLHFGGQFNIIQNSGDMIVVKDAEYSKIVFDRDKYANKMDVYADVSTFLDILMTNDYTAKIRQEESLIIVEYTHNNDAEYFGGTELMFLSEDEAQLIEDYRHEDQCTARDALQPKLIESE